MKDGSSAPNWDPLPAERKFVRHRQYGDLGWLVRRDAREMVRLDRVHEDVRPISRDPQGNMVEWEMVKAPALLTVWQVGIIAYNACRDAERYLGIHGRAKPWMELHEDERRKWVSDGPDDSDAALRVLYLAIMDSMNTFVQ